MNFRLRHCLLAILVLLLQVPPQHAGHAGHAGAGRWTMALVPRETVPVPDGLPVVLDALSVRAPDVVVLADEFLQAAGQWFAGDGNSPEWQPHLTSYDPKPGGEVIERVRAGGEPLALLRLSAVRPPLTGRELAESGLDAAPWSAELEAVQAVSQTLAGEASAGIVVFRQDESVMFDRAMRTWAMLLRGEAGERHPFLLSVFPGRLAPGLVAGSADAEVPLIHWLSHAPDGAIQWDLLPRHDGPSIWHGRQVRRGGLVRPTMERLIRGEWHPPGKAELHVPLWLADYIRLSGSATAWRRSAGGEWSPRDLRWQSRRNMMHDFWSGLDEASDRVRDFPMDRLPPDAVRSPTGRFLLLPNFTDELGRLPPDEEPGYAMDLVVADQEKMARFWFTGTPGPHPQVLNWFTDRYLIFLGQGESAWSLRNEPASRPAEAFPRRRTDLHAMLFDLATGRVYGAHGPEMRVPSGQILGPITALPHTDRERWRRLWEMTAAAVDGNDPPLPPMTPGQAAETAGIDQLPDDANWHPLGIYPAPERWRLVDPDPPMDGGEGTPRLRPFMDDPALWVSGWGPLEMDAAQTLWITTDGHGREGRPGRMMARIGMINAGLLPHVEAVHHPDEGLILLSGHYLAPNRDGAERRPWLLLIDHQRQLGWASCPMH